MDEKVHSYGKFVTRGGVLAEVNYGIMVDNVPFLLINDDSFQ